MAAREGKQMRHMSSPIRPELHSLSLSRLRQCDPITTICLVGSSRRAKDLGLFGRVTIARRAPRRTAHDVVSVCRSDNNQIERNKMSPWPRRLLTCVPMLASGSQSTCFAPPINSTQWPHARRVPCLRAPSGRHQSRQQGTKAT